MMKGFERYGKFMGLALLACGLVFAGCAGSPSSSEEDAVSGQPVAFSGEWTATLTEDSLVFGDGGQSAIGQINGHTVEIINDPGCSADGSGGYNCYVRIINRAKNKMMTEARGRVTWLDGTAATWNNADWHDDVLTGTGYDFDGNRGVAVTPLVGSAFCIVEHGKYGGGIPEPYNEHGCFVHPIDFATNRHQPVNMLHPEGGYIGGMNWNFSSDADVGKRFRFTFDLVWQPWLPLDDPRHDPNKSTIYVMIGSLYEKSTAVNRGWYRPASYKRAHILAGYGWGPPPPADEGVITTGPGGATIPKGRYFGVNVAVEYPDVIEQQIVADPSKNDDYGWYDSMCYIMKYNPQVVRRITAAVFPAQNPEGTFLALGVNKVCTTCDKYTEAYAPHVWLEQTTNDAAGYIVAAKGLDVTHQFEWLTFFQNYMYGHVYATVNGGSAKPAYGNQLPIDAGHKGRARVNVALGGQSVTNATATIQDGIDPEPDLPWSLVYFQVRRDAESGMGSEFHIKQFAKVGYVIKNTQPDIFPEGGISKDDPPYYVPGWSTSTGIEIPNHDYPTAGSGMQGGGLGAFQQWPVYVIAQ